MAGPLKNEKRELFAQELAKGATQEDAYRAAGYAGDKTAACRAAAFADVRGRVEEIQARAAAKAEVTIERVLRELALIGFANMEDFLRIGPDGDPYYDFSTMSRDQAAAIAEVTVEDFKDGRGESARDVRRIKLKLADKRAALVDMGRHLGMFRDRIEHSGVIGITISPDDERL